MGVQVINSTMIGAVTPTCNNCGVVSCWDISKEDYAQDLAFWEAWICSDCNGNEPFTMLQFQRRKR